MYKFDDEFRPSGRVFMKATRETNGPNVPVRKSSLKKSLVPATSSSTSSSLNSVKGPPITTNLDNRAIQFQHEVTHEKTIEAIVTEFPPATTTAASGAITNGATTTNELTLALPSSNQQHQQNHHQEQVNQLQAITKNIRTSSDIHGQSFETVKTSQRQPDGNRRITTHIVRKVTTVSRAEESQNSQDLIREAKKTHTMEFGCFETTNAIEPKRAKVFFVVVLTSNYYCLFYLILLILYSLYCDRHRVFLIQT